MARSNSIRRDSALEAAAESAFKFIALAGVSVTDSIYDATAFGNAQVILKGDSVDVRVTRDRGQYLIDLAPRGSSDWYDDDIILHFVGASNEAKALAASGRKAIAGAATALEEHWWKIVLAFRPAEWTNVKTILDILRSRRAEMS